MESVCLQCFATVSHTWGLFSLTTDELPEVEAAHVCKSKGQQVHRPSVGGSSQQRLTEQYDLAPQNAYLLTGRF